MGRTELEAGREQVVSQASEECCRPAWLGFLECTAHDLCLGGSSSKVLLWLHPSPLHRTWFWKQESPVVVSNNPVCTTPMHSTAEFTGELAQTAPWQLSEAVHVIAKASRRQWRVQGLAELGRSPPGRASRATTARARPQPLPHRGHQLRQTLQHGARLALISLF